VSESRTELIVDDLLRNHPRLTHRDAEFQRFFTFKKGINNAAGFRVVAKEHPAQKAGRKSAADLAFVVLVTTFGENEWPDSLDLETGQLVYYGDNRHPGSATNKTSLGGNSLLDDVYERLHRGDRASIPPFLIFQSIKIDGKANMKFLGVAAPVRGRPYGFRRSRLSLAHQGSKPLHKQEGAHDSASRGPRQPRLARRLSRGSGKRRVRARTASLDEMDTVRILRSSRGREGARSAGQEGTTAA
jgi:hypothetical protein